jgi:peptide/nickel transport system permease protein
LLRYAAVRIATTVPLLVALSVIAFFGIRLLPGDPIGAMLGIAGNPELVDKLRHRYGFDLPLVQQYVIWLTAALRGDFGVSVSSQQEIGPLIAQRFPATVELMLASLVIAVGIAIPGGIVAGMNEGGRIDRTLSLMSFLGLGIPSFFLGMLFIVVFSLWLRVLPAGGYQAFAADPLENLRLLLMPAAVMGIASAPYLLRLTRSEVISIRREPFVAYAFAKGLRARTIQVRYILRAALPALMSVLGLYVGLLLAGSITIEILFSWPGMARLFVGAVAQRDYAIVQALILLYGCLFIVINLAAELAQAALDPRVRLR